MKLLLIKYCLILGLLTINQPLWCQEFKNDAGVREKHFVSQVKQVDEFFERFNNDTNSFIREVYRSYKVKFKADRRKLVKSLFNYENKNLSQSNIDAFVEKAVQVFMPSAKNWYGENWFAEANCKFQYNSLVIDIPVILKTITDQQKRSKWVIAGIKPSHLKEPTNSNIPITVKTRKIKFIDPSSHGANFIELERDFDDKVNLSDYFENAFFYRNNAVQFYHAIMKDKIRFLFVKDIKYHFLNVDQYIFTVEYFPRETLNSGWLINNLKDATAKDKESYKKLLLGE